MRRLEGRAAGEYVERCSRRQAANLDAVEPAVAEIVCRVRDGGDAALRAYAEQWDGLAAGEALLVSSERMQGALRLVSPEFLQALREAATSIRCFAERQLPREWRQEQEGLTLGQIVRPLMAVGCYVPGGRYPLPSTLLMTVIPAQVAGVPRIVVTSPNPAPETLAAAALLGVEEFYCIGGAQAIAALAHGTETLARVEKIVGPGNSYVTAAKKLVAFHCPIDMLAGPTEAVIVAEEGNAGWIAADLVAQAEHDPEACSIFITSSTSLAHAVSKQLEAQASGNRIARAALDAQGAILVSESHGQALEWADALAPEHLTVAAADVPHVRHAGSIFVGESSSQVFGDYAAGPNHVLPTGGAARWRGGLSVLDFVKLITVQEVSGAAMQRLARTSQTLATAEGLTGHAHAAELRMEAVLADRA